jgi:hypothetical protein
MKPSQSAHGFGDLAHNMPPSPEYEQWLGSTNYFVVTKQRVSENRKSNYDSNFMKRPRNFKGIPPIP